MPTIDRRTVLATALAAAAVTAPAYARDALPFLQRNASVEMTLPTGALTTLGQLAPIGAPSVIHFWATWCAPCAEEMRALSERAAAWRKQGISMLGIYFKSASETPERVQKFLQQNNGARYTHAAADLKVYHLFNESGFFTRQFFSIPKLYVFDAAGGQVFKSNDFNSSVPPKIEKILASLRKA